MPSYSDNILVARCYRYRWTLHVILTMILPRYLSLSLSISTLKRITFIMHTAIAKCYVSVFYLFSSTPVLSHIIKLTRVNVVDNSELGKPYKRRPTCIGLYCKKKVATIGDTILLAIRGQKQKALVIGCRQYQKPNVPKFDVNNVILIDDSGSPIGTRVKVPVPSLLRGWKDTAKIVAIAKRFV